jgi:hypothetical protein
MPHLKGHDLIEHMLVHKVCNKLERRLAERLVAAAIGELELLQHAGAQKQADLWKLGVHDSHQSRKDRREGETCSLRFHHRLAQQTLPPDDVLAKEFWKDGLDVARVYL